MISSIFKFILVATAAAPHVFVPAAAQILSNFDINFQSLETNFTQGVVDEIMLDYHIGKGRNYTVATFNKDCISTVNNNAITSVTPIRTNGVTAEHDRLKVLININTSTMATSNIWIVDKQTVELCVWLKLTSGSGSSLIVINEA